MTKATKTRTKFRVWTTVTVAARSGFTTRTKTSRAHPITIEAADFDAAMRIAERKLAKP